MRGKKRTKEEQYELIEYVTEYLEMGFSLKKACNLAGVPYSSVRDMVSILEPLRAAVTAAQNKVNVQARQNLINSIAKGNIQDSKWWMERMDRMEAIIDPVYGGMNEAMMQVIEDRQGTDKYRAESIEHLQEMLQAEAATKT